MDFVKIVNLKNIDYYYLIYRYIPRKKPVKLIQEILSFQNQVLFELNIKICLKTYIKFF
jgi:hypothetical protein